MRQVSALELIAMNPRTLTQRNRELINAKVEGLLAAGFVVRAPRKATGYAITPRGQMAMSSARTGVPMPPRVKGEVE